MKMLKGMGKNVQKSAGRKMKVSWLERRLQNGLADCKSALHKLRFILSQLNLFFFFLSLYVFCSGKANSTALKYYIDHFDFSGLRLDNAFRSVAESHFLLTE
jgi:hypothetical protein